MHFPSKRARILFKGYAGSHLQENTCAEAGEPEKCDTWGWVPFREIPEPRFAPLQKLIDSGFNPDEDREVKSVLLADVVVNPSGGDRPHHRG
jgi:hypothetical protein